MKKIKTYFGYIIALFLFAFAMFTLIFAFSSIHTYAWSYDENTNEVISDNLILLSDVTETTTNGITYSVSNGVVNLKTGTASQATYLTLGTFTLSVGSYYIKAFGNNAGTYQTYFAVLQDNSSQNIAFSYDSTTTGTFTLNEPTEIRYIIVIRNAISVSNIQFKDMVISGSTAPTEFEPGGTFINKNNYYNLLEAYNVMSTNYYNLVNRFNTLQTAYNTLEAQYSALQDENADLQDSFDVLEEEYMHLGARLAELQDDYDELQDDYDELQDDYDELQDNYDELLGNYNSLQQQYNNLVSQLSVGMFKNLVNTKVYLYINGQDVLTNTFTKEQTAEYYIRNDMFMLSTLSGIMASNNKPGYVVFEFDDLDLSAFEMYFIGNSLYDLNLEITYNNNTITTINLNGDLKYIDLEYISNNYTISTGVEYITQIKIGTIDNGYVPNIILSSRYAEGYDTGYNEATLKDSAIINDLNNQITILTNKVVNMNQSLNTLQSAYNDLNQSYTNMLNGNNFANLFFTIAESPFSSFKQIWNVDFLGVNLAGFVTGILFLGLIIWVIKKIF